jgi:norsolorinic acid ketoreductase
MTLAALESHMMVNMYSVLLLFQGAKPLLEKGRDRKFVYIGAPISTITDMEECKRAPLGAYSVSKLATNWLVRKWHYENEWLVAFVVDPG